MSRTTTRLALIALALTLAGCNPAPEAKPEPPPPPAPPVAPPAPGPIDYASWAQLTAKPVPVGLQLWLLCRPRDDSQPLEKEAKKLGPHAVPAIRVFANPTAHAHLTQGRPGVLPVGAVIVKEKLISLEQQPAADGERPLAYAAMIKREPGYDPAHGDWEYVYQELRGEKTAQRGRLGTCIDCHRQEAAKDYLFRKYDK